MKRSLADAIGLHRELTRESDRGMALLSASYLDSRLQNAIRHRLCPGKKQLDKLLGVHGAAGTFSARIDLAMLIGIIGTKPAKALHIIRGVRNEFAHHPAPMDFETPVIASKCGPFSQFVERDSPSPRHIFVTVSLMCLSSIETANELIPKLEVREEKFFVTKERAELLKSIASDTLHAIQDGRLDHQDIDAYADHIIRSSIGDEWLDS